MITRRWIAGLLGSLPFLGLAPKLARSAPASASATATPPARRVYAHAGEIVICENGHPICLFAETVHYGDMQALDKHLKGFMQPRPTLGQMLPIPCEVCGAEWYRGGVFHFSDGWRCDDIQAW